jgi:hypothetical protein
VIYCALTERVDIGTRVRYQITDFARLYGIVTSNLATLAGDGTLNFKTANETEWFSYLIVVFQQLFEDWERDPNLTSYLSALERWPPGLHEGHTVHRAFRLGMYIFTLLTISCAAWLAHLILLRPCDQTSLWWNRPVPLS